MKNSLISDLRHYKGMTQPQFAQYLGVTESTIAAVEAGYRNVSDGLQAKIAMKIDITDADFIEYQKRRRQTSAFFKNNN